MQNRVMGIMARLTTAITVLGIMIIMGPVFMDITGAFTGMGFTVTANLDIPGLKVAELEVDYMDSLAAGAVGTAATGLLMVASGTQAEAGAAAGMTDNHSGYRDTLEP